MRYYNNCEYEAIYTLTSFLPFPPFLFFLFSTVEYRMMRWAKLSFSILWCQCRAQIYIYKKNLWQSGDFWNTATMPPKSRILFICLIIWAHALFSMCKRNKSSYSSLSLYTRTVKLRSGTRSAQQAMIIIIYEVQRILNVFGRACYMIRPSVYIKPNLNYTWYDCNRLIINFIISSFLPQMRTRNQSYSENIAVAVALAKIGKGELKTSRGWYY